MENPLDHLRHVLDALSSVGMDARKHSSMVFLQKATASPHPLDLAQRAELCACLNSLFALLAEKGIEDTRTDAALLFLTQQKLSGAYRRLSQLQKDLRKTKEMLDKAPLRVGRMFVDQQTHNELLAW